MGFNIEQNLGPFRATKINSLPSLGHTHKIGFLDVTNTSILTKWTNTRKWLLLPLHFTSRVDRFYQAYQLKIFGTWWATFVKDVCALC